MIMTTSKNKKSQHRQMLLWTGALVAGAAVGMVHVGWIDSVMEFIASVYTRLFQLLAVPTIVLAVITTLSTLGGQKDSGRIFRTALKYSSFGSKNSVLYAVCASWLSNAILRLSAMTCLSTVSSSHSSISATMQTTSSIASQMQSMTVISLNPRYVSLNRPPIVS